MLPLVLRAISVVLVLAAPLGPAGAEPRVSGKVVRVERRSRPSGPLRMCEIKSDGSGMCFGDAPVRGDIALIADEQQVAGEVRIDEVTALNAQCDSLWKVTGEVLAGDLSNSQWGRTIGVINGRLDRRTARKLPDDHLPTAPSGDADQRVIGAVDRTNSGSADVLITQYTCDLNMQANVQGNEQCFDLWSREQPGGWRRVRPMLVSPCFR